MTAYNPFPNLRADNHRVTSPETPDYNCIAWAAGETHRRWWPIVPESLWYWPSDIARVATIGAFVQAFQLLGYRTCAGPELEQGHEKVALYVDPSGIPKHMARQLPSGKWTSKLGQKEDIEHATVAEVEGPLYGIAVVFLKRPNPEFVQV